MHQMSKRNNCISLYNWGEGYLFVNKSKNGWFFFTNTQRPSAGPSQGFTTCNICPMLRQILRESREQCADKWWGWSLPRKKIASTWGVTVGFSTARISSLFNSHTNKYLVSVYWLIFRQMYLNQKKYEKV